MQVLLLQNLGWILLFAGIILVLMSVISASKNSDSEDYEQGTQSKGVIFLGPIPIVWGYGRKGWMIAGTIGIILLLVWIITFL